MINLFCFPFAGGSSYVYTSWKNHLKEDINLNLVELAGRGMRMGEALYPSMDEMIDDLYHKIKNSLGTRFAFFGHSMGALITYELALKISREDGLIPEHIFLSGRGYPKLKEHNFVHELSDEEFKDVLINLEGTPKEVFLNSELSKLFVPIIRNDYKLVERYAPRNGMQNSIQTKVTVLSGIDDVFTTSELENWSSITNKDFNLKYFDGGHFFINNKKEEVINYINEML